jgi:dethiobiotin synthetase
VTRACFVTATDTGVGKTILTATIVAGLLAGGLDVTVRKPVLTGAAEPPAHRRPPMATDLSQLPDHELLGAVSGERPADVSPARYEAPVAPPLAGELPRGRLDRDAILDSLRAAAAGTGAIVVEGIGGLLVPLAASWDVRRLAQELGWPVIVAARSGLGTINHTLLTLEAARNGGLDVRAVVLTPWPAAPDAVARSNRDLIERLGEVEVATLPALPAITRATLAEASAALAYEPWLVVA